MSAVAPTASPDGAPVVRRLALSLSGDPGACHRFRETWRGCGPDRGLSPRVCELTMLLGSELVTNAVVRAATPVHVEVSLDGRLLRLAVSDARGGHPGARHDPSRAAGGRGSHLLGLLADAWGVRGDPDGKTVWCCLVARPEAASGRRRRCVARPPDGPWGGPPAHLPTVPSSGRPGRFDWGLRPTTTGVLR